MILQINLKIISYLNFRKYRKKEVLVRNMFQNLGKNQSANVWFVMKNLLKK